MSEGGFTSTYKFALLLALSDLCVELDPSPDSTAVLLIENIGAKFIQYYWNHTAPYPGAMETGRNCLFQNSNEHKEAKILSIVRRMQAKCGLSIGAARNDAVLWNSFCRKVAKDVVEKEPLNKLQTFGRDQYFFLYENPDISSYGGKIILKPGVAFFLRRFRTFTKLLVQEAWARRIREFRANQQLLGNVTDLHQYLFGSPRQDLSSIRSLLFDIQDSVCFYCEHKLVLPDAAVDHFVPWSTFSIDLGHNFVLAHCQCNTSKSDALADTTHLKKWVTRNIEAGELLATRFQEKRVAHDMPTTLRIASWAYEQTDLSGGAVWLKKKEFRKLSPDWKTILLKGSRP